MYSAVTTVAEPMEKKTSVMKKLAVVGLFMGCMCMSFMAGTKYTSMNASSAVMNADVPAGDEAIDYTNIPFVDTGMLTGIKADNYEWIMTNAMTAFQGIIEDPNDPVNWDLVARAYCNVVKMYCAYKPGKSCEEAEKGEECRPKEIVQKYGFFCLEGEEEQVEVEGEDGSKSTVMKPGMSAKDKACNHLDYVNGPGAQFLAEQAKSQAA